METILQAGGLRLPARVGAVANTAAGLRLSGRVRMLHPFGPTRFFRHGWQSWSLCGWMPLDRPPAPGDALRPQTDDPVCAGAAAWTGSGVGALEVGDRRILLLGALRPGAFRRPRPRSRFRTPRPVSTAGAVSFRDLFGSPPAAVACAPARVNLLGEHTDYNEGFVLPVPLPLATCVEAGVAEGLVEAYSVAFGERRARGVDAGPQGDWLDYPAGCVWALRREGFDVPGVRLRIDSTVPLGVGLSSSAALEVAVMRAVRQLYGLALDDLHLAQLAQRAEVEFVGVRCGIMDQMVASVGQAGTALLLDTRDLRYEHLPLLPGHRMVVIDSGVRRHLAEGKYNRRRVECERAARLLGVCALRDLTPDDLLRAETLPDPLPRRVRHVVCENARVWAGAQALRQADAITFGRLMSESHRSLRDDFEVSTPELDRLVEAALRARALGARLTGAGFGGAVVAVVPLEALDTFGSGLARAAPSARILVR